MTHGLRNVCNVTKSNNPRGNWLQSSPILICWWSVPDRDRGYTDSCSIGYKYKNYTLSELYALTPRPRLFSQGQGQGQDLVIQG